MTEFPVTLPLRIRESGRQQPSKTVIP